MNILTSKIFWVDIITVVVVAINYAVTKNLFPDWVAYMSWAVAILTAIGGIINGQQLSEAKATLAAFRRNQ